MEFLPTTTGARPRIAVEIRPELLVAARADASSGLVSSVTQAVLPRGIVAPGLRAGNLLDRTATASALRRTLEGLVSTSDRGRYVTLVVPDAAVRVLLLDFDALPGKASEALPVVRFRLKKLLPFEVDQAVVSYQIMSNARNLVQVLAVAIPCDVLTEYEAVVTEAGYLAGAVLPSTLAALAALQGDDNPALVVNANAAGVTTAIVQNGVVLLHRTVDLGLEPQELPFDARAAEVMSSSLAAGPDPLQADRSTIADRAWQAPVPGIRNASLNPDDYDRMDALTSVQAGVVEAEMAWESAHLEASTSAADLAVADLNRTPGVSAAREVAQAVSVAAAYFEDTLGTPPRTVLSVGTMGAEALAQVLGDLGFAEMMVRELVRPSMLEASAVTASVARGWIAGVRGALNS